MTGLKGYSTTPADNTELFPEGMSPGAVNNGVRQILADIAADYRDREWIEYGTGSGSGTGATDYSTTYISATKLSIAGADVTSAHAAGRAFRITGSLTGTIYGEIASSVYTGGDTEITVTSANSILNDTDLRIWISALSPDGRSLPSMAIDGKPIDMDGEELSNAAIVAYREKRSAPSIASGILTVDPSAGNTAYVLLDASVSSVVIDDWPTSSATLSLTLFIQQDGTGGRTVGGWPAAIEWLGGGGEPVISTGAWAVDVVTLLTLNQGAAIIGGYAQGAAFSSAIA